MLSHQKTGDSRTPDSTPNDPTLDNTDQADTTVGALEGDIDNSMNEAAEEEEPQLNLEDALAQLNLSEFLPKFQEERIDMESLVNENLFHQFIISGLFYLLYIFITLQVSQDE